MLPAVHMFDVPSVKSINPKEKCNKKSGRESFSLPDNKPNKLFMKNTLNEEDFLNQTKGCISRKRLSPVIYTDIERKQLSILYSNNYKRYL